LRYLHEAAGTVVLGSRSVKGWLAGEWSNIGLNTIMRSPMSIMVKT
jgi:hypothetical protein